MCNPSASLFWRLRMFYLFIYALTYLFFCQRKCSLRNRKESKELIDINLFFFHVFNFCFLYQTYSTRWVDVDNRVWSSRLSSVPGEHSREGWFIFLQCTTDWQTKQTIRQQNSFTDCLVHFSRFRSKKKQNIY